MSEVTNERLNSPASRGRDASAPGREEEWRRVEIYRGRVIITDGVDYMRFWSQQRYGSLQQLRAAIDEEARDE